jgi:hypothetical protein
MVSEATMKDRVAATLTNERIVFIHNDAGFAEHFAGLHAIPLGLSKGTRMLRVKLIDPPLSARIRALPGEEAILHPEDVGWSSRDRRAVRTLALRNHGRVWLWAWGRQIVADISEEEDPRSTEGGRAIVLRGRGALRERTKVYPLGHWPDRVSRLCAIGSRGGLGRFDCGIMGFDFEP